MNLPNILSMFRLILVPCFAVTYMSDAEHAGIYAGIIFVIAATTDVIDGYLARKWNQITPIGRILDPLADKLLQLTALSCLTIKGVVPWIPCIIFLAKELLMMIGSAVLVKKLDDVIPSNIFGKLVSFGVSATLTAAIFFHDLAEESCPNLFPVLFYVLTVLTIAAFVIYLISSIKCLKKKSIDLDARSGRLKL
ncbi:MAG: CDP-diacylglycerol--glycerol-3-phosphate 3-phosphatidyltransferase [Clostridia bacterium]|nr:CDP-diacylglycerol--glycerol-3-phosphate 3-phosphatidyltransferase [Clostridia bacterium]